MAHQRHNGTDVPHRGIAGRAGALFLPSSLPSRQFFHNSHFLSYTSISPEHTSLQRFMAFSISCITVSTSKAYRRCVSVPFGRRSESLLRFRSAISSHIPISWHSLPAHSIRNNRLALNPSARATAGAGDPSFVLPAVSLAQESSR